MIDQVYQQREYNMKNMDVVDIYIYIYCASLMLNGDKIFISLLRLVRIVHLDTIPVLLLGVV